MYSRRKNFAVLLAMAALAACSTPAYNYVPETNFFSEPPVGAQTVVSVGEDMLRQGQATKREALVLPQAAKVGSYTLSPGNYLKTGGDEESQFFSFLEAGMMNPSGMQMGVLSRNVFTDPPQSVEYIAREEKLCVVTIFNLHTCKKYPSARVTNINYYGDASFQQTLIYNGRVGDKINIGYREFTDSMARPAFANEVEYDLSVSDEFAYKGARIKVLEANNKSITYIVIQNFRGVQ